MKINKKIGWIGFVFCASLWGAPYTDNGNGTVSDSATGLVWQKCTAVSGTTLGNCNTGTLLTYTWSNAISYCSNLTLGGRDDWRLPNINELRSIVEYWGASPSINTIVFPNTPNTNGSSFFWSSSTLAFGTKPAWLFNYGVTPGPGTGYSSKTDKYYVRCVTGP